MPLARRKPSGFARNRVDPRPVEAAPDRQTCPGFARRHQDEHLQGVTSPLPILLLGAAMLAVPEASTADATPPCVHARAEARYANYGYDHWVVLSNGCAKAAACSVATDVNPTPVRVDVPRGASREVLTFRGSPASEFHATATCTLGE